VLLRHRKALHRGSRLHVSHPLGQWHLYRRGPGLIPRQTSSDYNLIKLTTHRLPPSTSLAFSCNFKCTVLIYISPWAEVG